MEVNTQATAPGLTAPSVKAGLAMAAQGPSGESKGGARNRLGIKILRLRVWGLGLLRDYIDFKRGG